MADETFMDKLTKKALLEIHGKISTIVKPGKLADAFAKVKIKKNGDKASLVNSIVTAAIAGKVIKHLNAELKAIKTAAKKN